MWEPQLDFENDLDIFEPIAVWNECNTSNGATANQYYPRPELHVKFALEKQKMLKAKQKPLTYREFLKNMGMLFDDSEDDEDEVAEERRRIRLTHKMMDLAGVLSHGSEVLGPNYTSIASHPIPQDMEINYNRGQSMPVLYNAKYFKLKPKVASKTEVATPTRATPILDIDSKESTRLSKAISETTIYNSTTSESPILSVASDEVPLLLTRSDSSTLSSISDETPLRFAETITEPNLSSTALRSNGRITPYLQFSSNEQINYAHTDSQLALALQDIMLEEAAIWNSFYNIRRRPTTKTPKKNGKSRRTNQLTLPLRAFF